MASLFPKIDDPAISSLRIASDKEAMTQLFKETMPGVQNHVRDLEISSARVVKHRPGRRCTILYDLSQGRRQVYVKIYYNKRGKGILNKMRKLKKACSKALLIPEAFAYLPEHRMLLIEGINGTPLSQLQGSALNSWVRRAAEALAYFHNCDANMTKVWTLRDEIAVLCKRIQILAVNKPKAMPTVLELVTLLWASEPDANIPVRPIHRDFYPGQVIALGDRAGFVDLDDSALGDPAIDVGNFLAHLKLLSFERHSDPGALARERDIFLKCYLESAINMQMGRIVFFEASTLLRLASLASDHPDRTEQTQAMLCQAVELLSSDPLTKE